MSPHEHHQRHVELHRALDELMSDFQLHTGRMLSVTSILELASWSHEQTTGPTGEQHDSRADPPSHWNWGSDYAAYRPQGKVDFQHLIDICAAAISFARARSVTRLLVDTTGLTGFGVPSTLDRFEFAERCASAPEGKIKVVFVALPDMIDPDRFGLDVARNRGFYTGIFATESEAIAWLVDVRT